MGRILVFLAACFALQAAPFGQTYPLLGEFSDLALDEARSVVYAANFTANRIEVFSTATKTWQTPIRIGIVPSALALAPDGRTLLILNFGSESLFQLDLSTREQRPVAIPPPAVATGVADRPRAVAFGSDGAALLITTTRVLRFDPITGVIDELLANLRPLFGDVPAPQLSGPAEIVSARMAVSQDGKTIFAVGTLNPGLYFAFRYSAPTRDFLFRCSSIVRQPVTSASIAPDGTRYMGGHVLLTETLNPVLAQPQMRVLADFTPTGVLPIQEPPAVPTAPPPNTPAPRPAAVIGGSVFSPDGKTIYASLVDTPGSNEAPLLYVLDADNLTIRQRIRLPERLTGKMISDAAGRTLYAVSEGGLTAIPVSTLSAAALIAVSADTLAFRFDACSKLPATATFDIVHTGGASVDFTLSSSMPGLGFSPTRGTTPARITVSFDPDQLFNVQGTAVGLITITSNASVNLIDPVRVLANLRDTDQRGTVFVQSGQLRDIQIDERRQRFYILDATRNRLLVFGLNDFALQREVRTGHFPLQMALAPDQKTLLVTNAQSETISRINLDTLQQDGVVYCPCSNYPRSIAVSTNATLVTTAVDRALVLQTADNKQVTVTVTEGRMNRVLLDRGEAIQPTTMGVFQNKLSARSLLTATPSGARILIAEDVAADGSVSGVAKVYDADADTFVSARAISAKALKGGAAANDTGLYSAGAVILGSSLTPLAEFQDAPNEHNSLVFFGSQMVRTMKPATGSGPGLISRVDTSTLRSIRPVKLTESPLNLLGDQPLRRTLAATNDGRTFITLSSSGFEVVPGNFDAFIPPAVIRSVTNAATFNPPVAPGSLISIFGDGLASLMTKAGVVPLPTFLADTCLTVNNRPVPLLFLSPGQINAQLPFEITGAATLVVHSPGGVSDAFQFQVPDTAPALFSSNFGDQANPPIPIIFRAFNQEPVTLSNPVRRGDVLTMFGNGFGRVTPALASGAAAPLDALLSTQITPTITIGGASATVLFSGLAPGFVGLNQLNIQVPLDAPLGFNVPLVITAGTLNFQVILPRVAAVIEP